MGLRSSNAMGGAAQGAAMGSMAGPWGALAGAGIGLGVSAWDLAEKTAARPKLASAMTNQQMAQTLTGRGTQDPVLQQRYAESLAPVPIASNMVAGGLGGYQFGQNIDDYRFKQKMREENPWAYLQAMNRGNV